MDKIAIVGMACLFPEAETPDEFWRNLVDNRDCRSLIDKEVIGIDPEIFYHPKRGFPDKFCTKKYGFVRGFDFDPTGYDISEEELLDLHDQAKWCLYVAKEALKDSGYYKNSKYLENCSLILGNLSLPTYFSQQTLTPIYKQTVEAATQLLLQNQQFKLCENEALSKLSNFNKLYSSYPAFATSKALSLKGACTSIDAACASSIYTIKLAGYQLMSGQADMVLAGAVCAPDRLVLACSFSALHAYPEQGESNPLDQFSSGLTTGEGAGMFVLKRYNDALQDKDKIYAIVENIGLSNDGAGKHLLSPNMKGQILALEHAYKDNKISMEVDYLECHATGTMLGDKTELDTMDQFYGNRKKVPLIGALKANIGHLLTASGMAGMMKILLSMSKGIIPATINVNHPLSSKSKILSSEQMVLTNQSWPQSNEPKCAALNAFGFGGTNAHIILKEHIPSASAKPLKIPHVENKMDNVFESIAIIGMDLHFGSVNGLDEFQRCIYTGEQKFTELPFYRWQGFEENVSMLKKFGFEQGIVPKGAYIDKFDFDFIKYKVPPKEDDRPMHNQLLMLKVTDNALLDAGIKKGQHNVAVLIGFEMDLLVHHDRARIDLTYQVKKSLKEANINLGPDKADLLENILKQSLCEPAQIESVTSAIGNTIANRISSLWDFTAPSFTVFSQENSTFMAIQIAQFLLSLEQIDAVVVGAVDLPGSFEYVLWRNYLKGINKGKATSGFERNINEIPVGEGAGCIVLKSLKDAQRDQNRIYAAIDSMSIINGNNGQGRLHSSPSSHFVNQCAKQAMSQTSLSAENIGYVEVFGNGVFEEDDAEIEGLNNAYRNSQDKPTCAIGSVKSNIGNTFVASGIASLIKTALCLYNRFIPATPNLANTKINNTMIDSPFYMVSKSRPWINVEKDEKRMAAINSIGNDGAYAHLVLSEQTNEHQTNSHGYVKRIKFNLLPITGFTRDDLLPQLEELQNNINNAHSIEDIAGRCYNNHKKHHNPFNYTLCIIGSDKDGILKEITAAREGMVSAFDTGQDWVSPSGSCFSAHPLGTDSKTAFVYPLAGLSYLEMGSQLPFCFTDLFKLEDQSGKLNRYTNILEMFYPRSLTALTPKELAKIESECIKNRSAMLISSIFFGLTTTKILRDVFHIKPDMAFGCSLGELSMINAFEIIHETIDEGKTPLLIKIFENIYERLYNMDLLKKDFPGQNVDWKSYYLKASSGEVKELLKKEKRVFVTIICSPNEIVISGHKDDCKNIIQKLNCSFSQEIDFGFTHSPLLKPVVKMVLDTLLQNSDAVVNNVPEVSFYSAIDLNPIRLNIKDILNNCAKFICNSIDFPSVIQKTYNDGARIFIDMGPGDNCTRWIRETLGDRRFTTIAMNKKGDSDERMVLSVLARLLTHRIPVNLTPFYKPLHTQKPAKSYVKPIIISREKRVFSSILNEEHKQLFHLESVASDRHVNHMETSASSGTKKTEDQHIGIIESTEFDENKYRQNVYANISSVQSLYLKMQEKFYHNIGKSLLSPSEALEDIAQQDQTLNIKSPLRDSISEKKKEMKSSVVWDESDISEMIQGKLSNILGKEYSEIDSYDFRARLPLPPFLFVSRVTNLDAKKGCYEPCMIEWEYDIPEDAWYIEKGRVSVIVPIESSHCNILLAGYLGCDLEHKGQSRYRVIDSTTTFYTELPKPGETFRGIVRIKHFVKTEDNLIFFYDYDCFLKDQLILTTHACAGFFSSKELGQSKGIIEPKKNIKQLQKTSFKPILNCPKKSFNKDDLENLILGDALACFGGDFKPDDHPFFSVPPSLRMMDKVTYVDTNGGDYGLGLIKSEAGVKADHWVFKSHFLDDPIMPGTMMLEGCYQILYFYMIYLGLHTLEPGCEPYILKNSKMSAKFRGQVPPVDNKLSYSATISKIALTPFPHATADMEVTYNDKIILSCNNLGIGMKRK